MTKKETSVNKGPKWLHNRTVRINLTLVAVSLLLIVLFGVTLNNFMSLGNFINMGHQMAITALVAYAMTAVILAKGIDLSVGSSLALAGVV
jgi:ribose transport system ATP-binding protein